MDKQVLRTAAEDAIEKYGDEWFGTGSQICTVHKSKIKLISYASPNLIIELLDEIVALTDENIKLNQKINKLLIWPGIEFDSSAWGFFNNDGDAALEFICDHTASNLDARADDSDGGCR